MEFVCGDRAVRMARRDFNALSESAALFSAKLWDVPEQIRKQADENRMLRKQKDDALEDLAQLMAAAAFQSEPEVKGRKVIVRVFSDRDINFAKLFAQKFTHSGGTGIALVASTLQPAGIVFAQTPSSTSAPGTEPVVDMGALLKQVLA